MATMHMHVADATTNYHVANYMCVHVQIGVYFMIVLLVNQLLEFEGFAAMVTEGAVFCKQAFKLLKSEVGRQLQFVWYCWML